MVSSDSVLLRVRMPPDLRDRWLGFARSELGMTGSAAVREQIESRLDTGEKTPRHFHSIDGERELADRRKSLRLSASEERAVRTAAARAGMKEGQWMVQQIRHGLTAEPLLDERDLQALDDSNCHLLAISRALNQLAKDSLGEPGGQGVDAAGIEQLRKTLRVHVKKVGQLIRSASERWPIQ